MRLHIQPCELERMFFYDIMLLYRRYEAYVKEENENQQAEEERYRDMYSDMDPKKFDMNSAMNNFKNGNFNLDNISKDFGGNFNFD